MFRFCALSALLAASLGLSAAQIPDEYIVTLAPGVDAGALAADLGLKPQHVYKTAFKGFAGHIPPGLLKKVQGHPSVVSVNPNEVISLVRPLKRGGKPQPEEPAGEVVPTGIRRIGADLVAVPDLSTVRVAILDTGIDLDHPDLNVAASGFDAFAADPSVPGEDGHGHGTHVAGTVGAIGGNDIGVVGVAPGVEVVAVRVLNDRGSGSTASVIAGIDWAADPVNDIDVANMSLGGGYSPDLDAALRGGIAAGVTFVVAAGNEDTNIDPSGGFLGLSPASVEEAITVSALDDRNGVPGETREIVSGRGKNRTVTYEEVSDVTASFSNYGTLVDVIAPGVYILSTAMGGGTTTMSGTSMATPHVAGLAALYVAANPGVTPDQVDQALKATGNADYVDVKNDGETEPLVSALDLLGQSVNN